MNFGFYNLPALLPGVYTLRAEKSLSMGFLNLPLFLRYPGSVRTKIFNHQLQRDQFLE